MIESRSKRVYFSNTCKILSRYVVFIHQQFAFITNYRNVRLKYSLLIESIETPSATHSQQ